MKVLVHVQQNEGANQSGSELKNFHCYSWKHNMASIDPEIKSKLIKEPNNFLTQLIFCALLL